MKKLLCAIFALISVLSQSVATEPDYRFSKQYVKSYVDDTKYLITSPKHWDKHDWMVAGAIGGVTAGLFAATHMALKASYASAGFDLKNR